MPSRNNNNVAVEIADVFEVKYVDNPGTWSEVYTEYLDTKEDVLAFIEELQDVGSELIQISGTKVTTVTEFLWTVEY